MFPPEYFGGFKFKEGENMSADASLRVTGGIY
jgi:hypothetical protein